MVQLSIIIPAIVDAATLEETLVSVLTHRPDGCEIVVPHAASYDDPYGMDDEVEFLDLPRRTSHGQLIARAINTRMSDFVHLLMPGCEVSDGWCEAALQQFSAEDVASVSPALVEDFDHHGGIFGLRRGIAGRRVESRRADAHVIGPTHTACFYRREALAAVDGWPAHLSLPFADFDIALSLAEAGYGTAIEPDCTIACAARDHQIISSMKRARDQERVFWRHRGGLFASLAHPTIAMTDCLLAGNPLRMMGAALGKMLSCFDIAPGRWHQRLVRDAEQSDAEQSDAEQSDAEQSDHGSPDVTLETDEANTEAAFPYRRAA